MRILITEPLSAAGLEILRPDFEIVEAYDFTPETLPRLLDDVDAIIIRSKTRLVASALERANRLKVIGRAGIGYDNIDLETASRMGVLVMNVPEGSTVSACEHTLGLMLALARNLVQAASAMKRCQWARGLVGVELDGKNLGVVGMGRIGSEIAHRARAFGMTVLAHDPYLAPDRAETLGVSPVTMDELLSGSDFITLHVPLLENTRGLIGTRQFDRMKRSAFLINCARGGIIDHAALVQALRDRRIAGAALDVFPVEPPDFGEDLFSGDFDNLLLTPHLGASTAEAQEKVALSIARQVRRALLDEDFQNSVNLPRISPEMAERVRPYLGLCERLASFLIQWQGTTRGLKAVFEGDVSRLDTDYLALAVMKGCLEQISDHPVNYVNAPILARGHGVTLEVTKSTGRASSHYRSAIQLSVVPAGADPAASPPSRVIGGLSPEGQPRLLEIADLGVDFPLEGYVLMVEHADQPGVVGRLGTILGQNEVNIDRMEVLRRHQPGRAMMLLTVDQPVAGPILDTLRELEEIHSATTIIPGAAPRGG